MKRSSGLEALSLLKDDREKQLFMAVGHTTQL